MAKLRNQRVLITGAAGGIGLCTAKQFAKAGSELIITDINAEALEGAAGELRAIGAKVETRVVDVTNRKAVEELASWIVGTLGGLDILINNAGIGHSGELAETGLDTWERLVNINFWGPLYHIYAFLPSMIKKKKGHIVNVSSGQAFFRLPTWGAYATIKLALGAFSEILHFELRKHDIQVTTVYPFMVNTPFYKGIGGDTLGGKLSMKLVPYYSMSPEKVGKIIFKAVKKQKNVEMVSILNEVGFYTRFFPPASNLVSMVSDLLLAKRS